MDRLTKRVDVVVTYVGDHKTWSEDTAAEMSADAIRDVLDRLAAYEDTEMSPEGLRDFIARWEYTVRIAGMVRKNDLEHINNLLNAESEGCLIVLPPDPGEMANLAQELLSRACRLQREAEAALGGDGDG